MFAKTIVLSDAFLDMPLSTRCLYFTLGMVADDDGFVNSPKSIMRQCGASQDDLNLLLAKKFIIGFDNGIIVIKHWRLHNYIQKDRYIPTKYSEQKEMLSIDSNNSYTLDSLLIEEIVGEPISDARKKRIEEYKNSDLPYSFSYKIRNAFIGKECPICNRLMGVSVRDSNDPIVSQTPMPTIQHNIPISKGGKHSLDNISVICSECNHSVQDNLTDSLNNDLVVEIWSKIQECDGNVYTGKVSIGKDSIDKNNINNNYIYREQSGKVKPHVRDRHSIPPTLEEVTAYCKERKNNVDPQGFIDHYDSNGWFVGKNKMKDWQAAVRTWEKNNQNNSRKGDSNGSRVSRLSSNNEISDAESRAIYENDECPF